MDNNKFDIIIIGAGVVGAAIARELSRFKVDVALVEKEADVGEGASSRNSGVIHAGFSYPVGSLKAELNMRGKRKIKSLSSKLSIPFKETEKLVMAFNKNRIPKLYRFEYIGRKNGTEVGVIGRNQIKKMEPNISPGKAALYSPTSAIVNPFEMTIALAENAVENGVQLFLNSEIKSIEKNGNIFLLSSADRKFTASYVINSAGVYADKIASFSGENDYKVYPCRGEYHVLDKNKSHLISRLIYPIPPIKEAREKGGGGIHLSPTIEGNILIGPSDEYIENKEDHSTTKNVMNRLIREGRKFLPEISRGDIINSYAGIRSKIVPPEIGGYTDYVIKKSPRHDNFINLLGIESPGLTAAPGIAEYVVDMVDKAENLKKDKTFQEHRDSPPYFNDLSPEEKSNRADVNPASADIVCRCENVTRKEILDAVRNPLGSRTIRAIKNRTRITMGRCQGGYCLEKVVQILREEGIKLTDIKLHRESSYLFTGPVKEVNSRGK